MNKLLSYGKCHIPSSSLSCIDKFMFDIFLLESRKKWRRRRKTIIKQDHLKAVWVYNYDGWFFFVHWLFVDTLLLTLSGDGELVEDIEAPAEND